MANLAGQRAQFTWALNQYNLAEDVERKAFFAKRMARYIAAAPGHGMTVEQVTQGQNYPAVEVVQYLDAPDLGAEPGPSEEQAIHALSGLVDSAGAVRVGAGSGVVYAYGYPCCPDRLKVGSTEVDTLGRIAAQIGTGTPDKPLLLLEIRTDRCRTLERALQTTLEVRGYKVVGAGTEWFRTSRDEVLSIYHFIAGAMMTGQAEPALKPAAAPSRT